jgi:hypothetical protein
MAVFGCGGGGRCQSNQKKEVDEKGFTTQVDLPCMWLWVGVGMKSLFRRMSFILLRRTVLLYSTSLE